MLWLKLFGAKTEEELLNIEKVGGEVMEQAVGAYRHVSATSEFQELARLRFEASCNEASAIANAESRGESRGMEKERLKNAQAMIAEGMGVDAVSRITGLTVDDILRL